MIRQITDAGWILRNPTMFLLVVLEDKTLSHLAVSQMCDMIGA